MIRAALCLVALAGLLHLAGGRDAVSVLSGTLPGSAALALLGLAYAGSWLAAVLLAPPLFAAGALAKLVELGTRRNR